VGLVGWCVQRQVVEAQGVETLLSHAALATLLVVALALPPGLMRLFQRHARLADLEGRIEKGGWLSPPIAFLALALGIAAGGLTLYQLARNLVIENTTESLSDVAHLKQHLVEHWLGETVGDLSTWMASPEVISSLQAWRRAGYSNGPQREQFVEILRRISKNEHLLEIGLRDARSGAILLPTPGDVDEAALRERTGSGQTVIHESGSGARGPTPRRVPSTQDRYFAAGVSATQTGTLGGLDERGVPVIAYATPIPGTP
jgi:hypothetical protein